MLTAVLGMAGGCSRSYDGSVVPTYEMGSDRVAGIPYLTLKRTALDPPNMRGIAPPPRLQIADDGFDAAPRAATARPAASQSRRIVRRSPTRASAAAERSDLRCRDEAPGPRQVRMVCE